MTDTPRADLYQRITDQIVAAVEAGAAAFRMPWHATGRDVTAPVNATTGKRYRGVNVVTLWATAETCGYTQGLWATYRQWGELGAQLRKGERSSLIVKWSPVDPRNAPRELDPEDDAASAREARASHRMTARAYHVFNAAQVDGYMPPAPAPILAETERVAEAEAFFDALGIEIRHGGDVAYYSPSGDFIQMPPFAAFRDGSAFYSVLAHEASHATGHARRLDRNLKGRFGDDAYAIEEIIAELGAAMACADLGLSVEPRPDHAAYVASWLDVLRRDKRAIFIAAGKAQAAVDWMHAQQPARGDA